MMPSTQTRRNRPPSRYHRRGGSSGWVEWLVTRSIRQPGCVFLCCYGPDPRFGSRTPHFFHGAYLEATRRTAGSGRSGGFPCWLFALDDCSTDYSAEEASGFGIEPCSLGQRNPFSFRSKGRNRGVGGYQQKLEEEAQGWRCRGAFSQRVTGLDWTGAAGLKDGFGRSCWSTGEHTLMQVSIGTETVFFFFFLG